MRAEKSAEAVAANNAGLLSTHCQTAPCNAALHLKRVLDIGLCQHKCVKYLVPLESADPVAIGTIAKHRLSIFAGTGQEITIRRDRTTVQLVFKIVVSANSKLPTALTHL
jgi:hypothetical protein